MRFIALLFILLHMVGCHALLAPPDSLASKADKSVEDGELDHAIEIYRAHIDERLSESDRPEWENPYFYLLMIGDVYMKKGDPAKATESYVSAESMGVETDLVSDRLLQVATWYEEKGDINGAIDHLLKFRKRDELRYDALLNELGRKLTELEEKAGAS